MIAWLEAGNAGPDTIHNSHALMAEDAARDTGGDVTFQDMEIGTADGCFGNSHDCVARHLKGWLGTVLQRLEARTAIDQRLHEQFSS